MHRTNKPLSFFLAFVLSCSMWPMVAYADEANGLAATSQADILSNPFVLSGQEAEDSSDTSGVAVGDDESASEAPSGASPLEQHSIEKGQEGSGTEGQSGDTSAASVISPEAAIKMVAIGRSALSQGDEQQIPVFLLDETQTIVEASLTLSHTVSGEERAIDAAECSRYAANFIFSTTGWALGQWKVERLEYKTDSSSFIVILRDAESLQFDIESQTSANDDKDVDTSFYAIEDGEAVETASLESALSIAEESAVDDAASPKVRTAVKAGPVVIGLDAGHGGRDPGTNGNGATESYLNERIMQYCAEELLSYSGVKVVYSTRIDGNNNATDRQARVKSLVDQGAQAVVSFHINAGGGHGVEVYAPNYNFNHQVGVEGTELAQAVLNELLALGLTDRGVIHHTAVDDKYPDGSAADIFGIQYWSKMYGLPGILIEHAFIDSSDYGDYLNSEDKLRRLGVADATGIARYYGLSKVSYKIWTTVDANNVARFSAVKLSGNGDVTALSYCLRSNVTGATKWFAATWD